MEVYRDNGEENGNYCLIGYILGFFRDNGEENGNYYKIQQCMKDIGLLTICLISALAFPRIHVCPTKP